mgnify:CR=1 FL=1
MFASFAFDVSILRQLVQENKTLELYRYERWIERWALGAERWIERKIFENLSAERWIERLILPERWIERWAALFAERLMLCRIDKIDKI